MAEAWTGWEGQIAGGVYPLRRFLNASDHSAVFLTESTIDGFLNAAIKLTPADPARTDIQLWQWKTAATSMLEQLQRDLFAVGARLADPAHRIADRVAKAAVGDEDVRRLESWIDQLEEELPPLRRFILAGGSAAGAGLHVARTVCRRAERAIVALGPDAVEPDVVVFVNRVSDLLFVMARAANHRAGQPETEW